MNTDILGVVVNVVVIGGVHHVFVYIWLHVRLGAVQCIELLAGTSEE